MPTHPIALSPALALLASRVQSGRQRATSGASVSPEVASAHSPASASKHQGGLVAPHAVASSLPHGLLSAFVQQASSLSLRQSRPSWLRTRVAQRDGNQCWFCRAPAAGTASLFSRALGGLPSEDNTVCACSACTQRFYDLDPWVDHWCNPSTAWTEAQAAQRIRAMSECLQHGLPSSMAGSPRAAQASLEKLRWGQPRVAVAVYPGEATTLLMPVSKPEASWSVLARIAKGAGAQVEATHAGVLVVDSAQWEPMALFLIEAGALLRRVSVPGFSTPEATLVNGVSNPRAGFRWDQLFQGARSIARAAKGDK